MKSEYGCNSEEISVALVKHSSYYDVWHKIIKCVNESFFPGRKRKKRKRRGKNRRRRRRKSNSDILQNRFINIAR